MNSSHILMKSSGDSFFATAAVFHASEPGLPAFHAGVEPLGIIKTTELVRSSLNAFVPGVFMARPAISKSGTVLYINHSFVRSIPFDNHWLTCVLTKLGVAHGVRLAPLHPIAREPISCSGCGKVAGCPKADPVHWIEHFRSAVQCAANRPGYLCTDCV